MALASLPELPEYSKLIKDCSPTRFSRRFYLRLRLRRPCCRIKVAGSLHRRVVVENYVLKKLTRQKPLECLNSLRLARWIMI